MVLQFCLPLIPVAVDILLNFAILPSINSSFTEDALQVALLRKFFISLF